MSAVNETAFYIAIAVSFFGFFALAFILLYPVHRFIKREEKRSQAWTDEAIAERRKKAIEKKEAAASEGDGASGHEDEPPELSA